MDIQVRRRGQRQREGEKERILNPKTGRYRDMPGVQTVLGKSSGSFRLLLYCWGGGRRAGEGPHSGRLQLCSF